MTLLKDIRDPINWPRRNFDLRLSNGTILAALPPALAPEELGVTDPYSYDRAPGSDIWQRYGDGKSAERPLFRLSGTWRYREKVEALSHVPQVEQAVKGAQELWWQNRRIATLDPVFPGTCLIRLDSDAREATFTLVFNTLNRVDWEVLSWGSSYIPPTTPTPPTVTQTTVTILVEGVPVQVPIWRTNA